ncbi:MAG TPA: MFS transporter [Blastocatellia bacterium]|nr:MFS transporter [Blastocatellia bacterium]
MNRVEQPRTAQIHAAATAFVALFSVVGIALYGLPLYYDYWEKEFGWSRAFITSGNALSKVVVAVCFGFIAGWVIDRFGPRRLMMVGVVMAGGALIGLGSVSVGALWLFYLFYLFNALGYVAGGPPPNQVLLARWFDRGRGKAMGFAYLGIGVGGAVVPQLSRWLTENYGWRVSLRVLGALMIVLTLPMAYLVKESPAAQTEKQAREPLAPMREIFRRPAFYLLAFASLCSIGAVGGANQHLKLYLTRDLNYSQGDAATFISLVLTFSIVGRLLMGWLADRLPKKVVMLLIYLLVASAIPLLFFAARPAVMVGFAAVFGLGLGGEYLIVPLIVAELFSVKVLGRLMGLIVTADGVAEALLPFLVGHLHDRTGNYHAGFMTLIALALAGAVAVVLLPQKKPATVSQTGVAG